MRLDAHFDMLPERAFQKRGFGRSPATLEGGKGGGSAPAADPNIGLAQQKLADISEQYLNSWKTEVWPAMKEATLKQEVRADEQFALDKEMQRKQIEASDVAMKEYQEKGTPLREALYKEAQAAGGEAEVNRQAALAMGDVKSQFGLQAEQNARQMKSYGIDPTSGKYQSATRQAGVMEAATSAAAATKARDAATQLGWAKKMDAAALAQGQFGNQASSTGLALTAGNQALGAGQTTIGNYGALGSSMGQANTGAMSGWGQVGQLGVQKYNADVNAYSAQQQANAGASAGFGSALGAIGAAGIKAYMTPAGSDIRTKEHVVVVGKAPNGLTIYEYEYKPEFKDRKHFGHGKYRGHMAHEVKEVYPDAISYTDDGYQLVDYSKVQ
jgi:hypothetical protein